MEKLMIESELLKSLQSDESLEDLFISNPRIKESYDLALPIYEGNYPINDINLIKYINALAYLGCENKVDELLIFLHFNYNKNKLKSYLEENLLIRYNQIIPEETIFITFIRYDMIEPFKYLNSNNNYIKDDIDFIQTCGYGRLNFTIFLYSLGGINIHVNNDEPFVKSCENGHLEIAQRLYKVGMRINSPIPMNSFKIAFKEACGNKQLEIIKWLIRLYTPDLILMFMFSLRQNSLEVAKFLLQYENFQSDLLPFYEQQYVTFQSIFRKLLTNGHLDTAKWLYNFCLNNNISINVHHRSDSLFTLVLVNGHLDEAKWLYSFGDFDIHILGNYYFKQNYNNDIKQWLRSLP